MAGPGFSSDHKSFLYCGLMRRQGDSIQRVAPPAPAAPTGEGLRFIKPIIANEGANGVATGDWDPATDLDEGSEGYKGWADAVTPPHAPTREAQPPSGMLRAPPTPMSGVGPWFLFGKARR